MKLSLYNVLSQLILGSLWFVAIIKILGIDLGVKADFSVSAIPISYVLGYFINALSSWLETLMFVSWKGKPSRNLLLGKGMRRIRFERFDKALQLLTNEREGKTDPNNPKDLDGLFRIALSYGSREQNVRIHEFNANYAFSRGLVISLLGVLIIMLIHFLSVQTFEETNLALLGGFFLALIAAWYRTKERGYYFAREVLNNYLKLKQMSSDT